MRTGISKLSSVSTWMGDCLIVAWVLLLNLKSRLDLISRSIRVVGSVLIQSSQLGNSVGWGCTEPVVLTTLGTTCGRYHNWVGIPARIPYVIPCWSVGWKRGIWNWLIIDLKNETYCTFFKLVPTVQVGLREVNLHFQFWIIKSNINDCLRSVIYLKLSDFYIPEIIFCLLTFNQVVNWSFWHFFQIWAIILAKIWKKQKKRLQFFYLSPDLDPTNFFGTAISDRNVYQILVKQRWARLVFGWDTVQVLPECCC